MNKQCPLCQNPFTCLDSDRCWCWNPDYSKFLGRIPDGTTDCVCEHCLTRLPEKKQVANKRKQDYVAGSNVAGIGT